MTMLFQADFKGYVYICQINLCIKGHAIQRQCMLLNTTKAYASDTFDTKKRAAGTTL